MKFAYFPGCSLEATSKEFDLSTRLLADALAVELVDIPDWNCCGATSAHSLDHRLSVALPARNLGIAEEMDLDVVAPCAACYNRMRSAEVGLRNDLEMQQQINADLEKPFTGKIGVRCALDIFTTPEMLEKIAEHVVAPLKGLRPVCYYGCLLTRPPKVLGFDDPEDPHTLDDAMKAAGAQPVDWYYKTECCGASFGISKSEIVTKLTGDIINNAKKQGANCIVTACPLCSTNLEMRQGAASKQRNQDLGLPVFFFTELLGVALDIPGIRKCFASHLVDVHEVLDTIGKEPTGV